MMHYVATFRMEDLIDDVLARLPPEVRSYVEREVRFISAGSGNPAQVIDWQVQAAEDDPDFSGDVIFIVLWDDLPDDEARLQIATQVAVAWQRYSSECPNEDLTIDEDTLARAWLARERTGRSADPCPHCRQSVPQSRAPKKRPKLRVPCVPRPHDNASGS